MMGIRAAAVVLSLGLVLTSGCETGDLSSGSDAMVSHFASSCRSSIGNWTTSALQQTQSLLATLQTIKERQSKDCAGLTSALQATQEIQRRLQMMSRDPAINSYRLAEERKLELMLALGRTNEQTDAALVSQLREELYTVELQIVRTRADASVSSRDRERHELFNGLADLNQYVLSLVSQGNLTACLKSAPHMPLGIASSLLTIGGNFATPVMGEGMSALGNLMSTTVNYVRKLPLEQAELDLESPRMQTALTCSLESISDLYCNAEDSYEFLQFALRSYGQRSSVSGVWKGMDLLGRRVPTLNRWLLKASSGVDPSDRYAADRLNAVWTRQSKLREITNLVVGELNETERLLEGVINPIEIDLRLKSGFKRIISHMYGDHSSFPAPSPDSNPIVGFVGKSKAVCQLSGPNTGCVPSSTGGSFQSSDELIDQYGIDPVDGFVGFRKRVFALLEDVEKLVSKELHNRINQDPDSLVAEATQAPLGQWSVLQVLRELEMFSKDYADTLRAIPPASMPGRDRAIAVVDDSTRAFSEVATEIESSAMAADVIQKIFERFKLLDGLQFVNQRISQMVSWELEARIRKGGLPEEVAADLLGAGLSLVEQLDRSGISVQQDADAIVSDLRNAQYISRENLRITTETFATTIGAVLAKVKASAQSAAESDPSDPANRRLAQMCILLLTTSKRWPESVDINLCKGTKLVSVYEGSGLTLSFDTLRKRILGKKPVPFKDRACVYSNFLRSARLFRFGHQPHALPLGVTFESIEVGPAGAAELIPILPRDFFHQIWKPRSASGSVF
ncbi:MAG: hypothetical protein NDI61_07415 [Bdellovibrionaceae bacterium]|nr:hypothetical protein [Pseudobdellovibrionaceae bacterium]